MGLQKTLSDLEQAGYAVRAFVLPACAVGTWHERKRTFIVGADASHSPCVRCGGQVERAEDNHDPERGIQAQEEGREILGGEPVGGGIFPVSGGGRGPVHQPGMGGVGNGIPPEVDGSIIWHTEPGDIPRLSPNGKDRAKRLKALGNAVVPAQAYPILKYIADIETGKCAGRCIWDGEVHGC